MREYICQREADRKESDMVDVRGFNFYYQGETVDGEHIYGEVGVETTDFDYAISVAYKEMSKALDNTEGGHIDLYHALNDLYICSVEV